MTLNAARESNSSMDRPNASPDFLGSLQWMRSFTVDNEKQDFFPFFWVDNGCYVTNDAIILQH